MLYFSHMQSERGKARPVVGSERPMMAFFLQDLSVTLGNSFRGVWILESPEAGVCSTVCVGGWAVTGWGRAGGLHCV